MEPISVCTKYTIVVHDMRQQGIKGLNIEGLNQKLGSQLQNLLNNDLLQESNSRELLSIEDDATCIKCHKNMQNQKYILQYRKPLDIH